MLEGKTVNLRLVEKEDLALLKVWRNDLEFIGEYLSISQESMRDLEKQYAESAEGQYFFIEKKDGTCARVKLKLRRKLRSMVALSWAGSR